VAISCLWAEISPSRVGVRDSNLIGTMVSENHRKTWKWYKNSPLFLQGCLWLIDTREWRRGRCEIASVSWHITDRAIAPNIVI
jgi:hypothetical protein